MIDKETQQRIKDAANIVEVVGDYVKLTRRGANYMGLCPFHNERTPSFSVSPQRNFCHCFSCKKGGSPVNFLMEKEGINYTEALLLLARKYNIPVEERELSDEERARMSEREAMFVANEWAMNYFHDTLFNTEEGQDVGLAYLYSRGITEEAIKKFKIGYSLDHGEALIRKARNEGMNVEVLKQVGIVGTSQSGHDYDKFRGRVIFPIRNSSGKPVAFGGRALRGELSKYINSPESALYKKSNELYGIYEAKSEIIKLERVYLMEGYLDVIGSWQAGLKNCVASSGTALTESQIALIHRFTENVTLIYDGDSAGIKASLRGIDMLLAQKLHVKVLLLPDGEDPDSFARKHTPEEFKKFIDTHQTDFISYKLGVLLNEAGNNPQQISEAVRSVVNSIAAIPDEIERIYYIKECSRRLDIEERILSKQVSHALLNRASITLGANKGQDFGSSVTIPKTQTADPTVERPSQITGDEQYRDGEFIRHEEEIIKYCIRYAYLELSPEEGGKNVLEYIGEEMEADGLTFSPSLRRVYNLLQERKAEYDQKVNDYIGEVENLLKVERESFREDLRQKGASLAQLKAEESKYQAEEDIKRKNLLNQFAVNFSVDFLINHEETAVRDIANRLIADRHILSTIYTRNGKETVPEENRLFELVPRALAELRVAILNKKVDELQKKVLTLSADNKEEQEIAMTQLNKILFIRSKIAENLGERIISPH